MMTMIRILIILIITIHCITLLIIIVITLIIRRALRGSQAQKFCLPASGHPLKAPGPRRPLSGEGLRFGATKNQSYKSKGIWRQGVGSFCKEFLCFNTMPCRHICPYLCTSETKGRPRKAQRRRTEVARARVRACLQMRAICSSVAAAVAAVVGTKEHPFPEYAQCWDQDVANWYCCVRIRKSWRQRFKAAILWYTILYYAMI